MSMMRNGLLRHMMRREEVGKRSMGSSAHSHGGKNYPFAMHFDVSNIHKKLGLAYGTLLWLWVFWRAKQDGKVVLGLEHPWDHHGESHDEGISQLLSKFRNEKSEIGERQSLVEDNE